MEQYTLQNHHNNTKTQFRSEEAEYQQALDRLASQMQGTLILPGHPEFETARTVWNSAFDSRPALIVRCLNANDVSAAVTFAREHGLEVAVRSGGHDYSGASTCNGGIVIDLSQMKAINIDPASRMARIEPGLTWGEVAAATQPHGLALTSGDVASVGVGGLMLGGGIGMMARKYGLTIDRLRAVELVTADGRLLRASENEHADLFWGVRGGGGNFGIATAFEVELHPAGIIIGGAVVYDAAEAETILQAYVRHAAQAPDELTTIAFFLQAPPVPFIPVAKHGTPVIVIAVCYAGDLSEGENVVAPLRKLATFALTQSASIPGMQHHSRSLFLHELNSEILHTLVTETSAIMAEGTMLELRVLGGAMSRIDASATAFAHRDKQAMVSITNSEPKSNDPAPIRARTERVWQAIQPHVAGAYANFLGDEGEQRIHAAYPEQTYARLAALKRRYDPTNLFHRNQNIKPA
jgi:FAD/FMN-containing dehydrogenase